MINKFPLPESDYKVMVRCNTYNQRNYITDALRGFAMQKTNFPFCVVVIDDASTDGEQTVIKDFINRECDMNGASLINSDIMESLVVNHKTNANCTFVVMLLKENHWQHGRLMLPYYEPWRNRCLYESLCEGDDYWTTDDKLQIQEDFMESHPEFSMCIHKVNTLAEGNRKYRDIFGYLETREYKADDVFKRWTCPTCSMFYKVECIKKMPCNEKFVYHDSVWVLTCLSQGKIFCFGDSMGVYRLNDGGWTAQSKLKQFRLHVQHHKALYESFPICKHPQFEQNIRNCMLTLMIELKTNKLSSEYKTQYDEYFEYFKDDSQLKIWLLIHKGVIKNIIKKIIGKK